MDAINIVITRVDRDRTWLATIVGDGRSCGLGPTPGKAVDELFRWRVLAPTVAASVPPGITGGEG